MALQNHLKTPLPLYFPRYQALWGRWTLACGMGEFLGIGAAASVAVAMNQAEPFIAAPLFIVLNTLAMLVAGAAEGTITGYMQWTVLHQPYPFMTRKGWVGKTIAGACIAWLLGMLPSIFMSSGGGNSGFEPPVWLMALVGAGMGLLLGAMLGYFQYLELRKHAFNARAWIWANALGWMAGLAIIMVGATLPDAHTPLYLIILSGVTAGLLGGLAVGAITGISLLRINRRVEEIPGVGFR